LKRLFKSYLTLSIFTLIIVGLDQATKTWVRNTIPVGSSLYPIESLSPFFRIVHWYNTGAAFGMLKGFGDVFTILAILVAVVIIYYFPRVSEQDWVLRLAMALELGGALGNLVDRLTIGHVIDFLSFGNFPVFNIADSCITIGVGVLILGMLFQDWKDRQKETENNEIEPSDEISDQEGLR